MKRVWVSLMLTIALMGGCNRPPQRYRAVGYVRSVWVQNRTWTVVFEGENGVVFSIVGIEGGVPPVWQGLHAEIEYEEDDLYSSGVAYKNMIVTRRLP